MSRANPRFRRVNPPLPAPTNNLFNLYVLMSLENQLCLCTFGYRDNKVLGTLAVNEEGDLLGAWQTANLTNFKACLSTDVTITGLRVQCLTSPTRIFAVSVGGFPTAGTVAGGHAPTEVAVPVFRQTAYRGQRGRGRFSAPGVPLTYISNSILTGPGAAVFNTLTTGLIAPVVGASATYTHGIISRTGPRASPTYGNADISFYRLPSLLGTIRRRKIGRGR